MAAVAGAEDSTGAAAAGVAFAAGAADGGGGAVFSAAELTGADSSICLPGASPTISPSFGFDAPGVHTVRVQRLRMACSWRVRWYVRGVSTAYARCAGACMTRAWRGVRTATHLLSSREWKGGRRVDGEELWQFQVHPELVTAFSTISGATRRRRAAEAAEMAEGCRAQTEAGLALAAVAAAAAPCGLRRWLRRPASL